MRRQVKIDDVCPFVHKQRAEISSESLPFNVANKHLIDDCFRQPLATTVCNLFKPKTKSVRILIVRHRANVCVRLPHINALMKIIFVVNSR